MVFFFWVTMQSYYVFDEEPKKIIHIEDGKLWISRFLQIQPIWGSLILKDFQINCTMLRFDAERNCT